MMRLARWAWSALLSLWRDWSGDRLMYGCSPTSAAWQLRVDVETLLLRAAQGWIPSRVDSHGRRWFHAMEIRQLLTEGNRYECFLLGEQLEPPEELQAHTRGASFGARWRAFTVEVASRVERLWRAVPLDQAGAMLGVRPDSMLRLMRMGLVPTREAADGRRYIDGEELRAFAEAGGFVGEVLRRQSLSVDELIDALEDAGPSSDSDSLN